MELIRLNEVLPTPTTSGIFSAMGNLTAQPVPWADADITNTQLDVFFFFRHGERPVSPFLARYIVDGKISSQRLPEIAGFLYNINIENWSRLWESYTAEYNPINNYDMTEEEKTEYGKTNTHEIDTLEEYVPRTSVETAGQFNGFNSDSAVDTGKSTVTGLSGKDETADTGEIVDTQGGSDTRTLTRSGNIGVTTSAQMITQEIALWKWNYFDTVFADICKYIALPIY